MGIAILLTVLFIEVFICSGMERVFLASCLPVTRHIHVYNTRLRVAPRAPPLPALMTRQCPKASGLLGSRPPSFTPLFSLLHLHRLVAGWVFLTQVVGSRGSLSRGLGRSSSLRTGSSHIDQIAFSHLNDHGVLDSNARRPPWVRFWTILVFGLDSSEREECQEPLG